MANNSIVIHLYPKKDLDLLRLADLVSYDDNINFSEIVFFAIEYYLKYNDFYKIAKVKCNQRQEYKEVLKHISLKNDNIVNNWVNEGRKTQGFKLSNRVKTILRKSIEIVEDESEEEIIPLYEILLKLDWHEAEDINLLPSNTAIKPSETKLETKQEKSINNTSLEEKTEIKENTASKPVFNFEKVETKVSNQTEIIQNEDYDDTDEENIKEEPALMSMFKTGKNRITFN